MDKDKINSKIEDLEAELQQLKQLANTPKPRTPEVGDVWKHMDGDTCLVTDTDRFVILMPMTDGGFLCDSFSAKGHCEKYGTQVTYLGKFDEVYVKISDVRDALRLRIYTTHCEASPDFEALRKLNIIKD